MNFTSPREKETRGARKKKKSISNKPFPTGVSFPLGRSGEGPEPLGGHGAEKWGGKPLQDRIFSQQDMSETSFLSYVVLLQLQCPLCPFLQFPVPLTMTSAAIQPACLRWPVVPKAETGFLPCLTPLGSHRERQSLDGRGLH